MLTWHDFAILTLAICAGEMLYDFTDAFVRSTVEEIRKAKGKGT